MKNDQPPTVAPSASSIVQRPEPGLARGRWEAPAWVFWAVAVVAVAACVGWAAIAYRSARAHGRRRPR